MHLPYAEDYKRWAKRGEEVPTEPELFADLRWIWNAYTILDASRPGALVGASNVPLQEIMAYAAHEDLDYEDRNDLLRSVRILDDEREAVASEKRASEKASKPEPKPPTPSRR